MLQKEMQMNMFETHVTRIIHRRTKMANPLLKPRDAVVLQDCFYIRKHLTDSNNNAMAENEDSEEAIKIYLEQMTRHLDTLQLTKNSHLKELNLLEKNNSNNNNNSSSSSEAVVTSLKTLLTMLNVEIQKYTSYISDPVSSMQLGHLPPTIDLNHETSSSSNDTDRTKNNNLNDEDPTHGLANGTFVVYEISIIHPDHPTISKHVRSEVLCSIYIAQPYEVTGMGGMSGLGMSTSAMYVQN